MALDLDKVIKKAQSKFTKKNEKSIQKQLVRGNAIPRPTQPEEFVYWPNSPWHLLTGVPGIPFGSIVQVAGKPDSGKSSLAMKFMKLAQDQGVQVILWDVEKKFSAKRFDDKFKGNSADLLVVNNKTILDGSDCVDAYIDSIMEEDPNMKILIVWDSVGGTLSKSENTKTKREGKQMAEAAKENGQAARGFVSKAETYRNKETDEERIAVLLINQTYANIGSHGQKESGGQKVEYHSSIILQMARVGHLFKTRQKIKRKVGIESRITCKKNHLMDGDDTIYQMRVDVTSGNIAVSAKDPCAELVDEKSEEFEVASEDELDDIVDESE